MFSGEPIEIGQVVGMMNRHRYGHPPHQHPASKSTDDSAARPLECLHQTQCGDDREAEINGIDIANADTQSPKHCWEQNAATESQRKQVRHASTLSYAGSDSQHYQNQK